MLPQYYPNYKTIHRRFQQWCQNEVLRNVLMDLANTLRDEGALDESECFVDATFAFTNGGGNGVGSIKRGKYVKITAIVELHGLSLSVSTHAANHHEVTLVLLGFDFYMIVAKPDNLIGDRAYDSGKLDEELREEGIEMIAPHRKNQEGADPGPAQTATLLTPLAGGTLLCLASLATSSPSSMRILRREFLRFCTIRNHLYPN